MRLVTYDRNGLRRLGAIAGDRVVDLPDAVGHPVFPMTMEDLVSNNGGTLLDAARHALTRHEIVDECAVPSARLLVPIIPSSLYEFVPPVFQSDAVLDPGVEGPGQFAQHGNGHRFVLGPDDEVAWPHAVRYLGCELEIGCVVGRRGRRMSRATAASAIFGYTLTGHWSAWEGRKGKPANRRKAETPSEFAIAIGPCVVTADEFDPSGARFLARIDGEIWSEGTLEEAGRSFPEIIAEVSRTEEVLPGEIYGSGAFGFGYRIDPGRSLRPGTVVELEAEGIGVLRNRVRSGVKAPVKTRVR